LEALAFDIIWHHFGIILAFGLWDVVVFSWGIQTVMRIEESIFSIRAAPASE
jgi:hypothetical protein